MQANVRQFRTALIVAVAMGISLSLLQTAQAQHNHPAKEYQEPPTLMERLTAMQRSLKSRINRTVKSKKSKEENTGDEQSQVAASDARVSQTSTPQAQLNSRANPNISNEAQHFGATNQIQSAPAPPGVGFANYQSPSDPRAMAGNAAQLQTGGVHAAQSVSPQAYSNYAGQQDGLQLNSNGHYVTQPTPPNQLTPTLNGAPTGYDPTLASGQFDSMQATMGRGPAITGQQLGQPGLTATEYALQLKQLNETLRQNLTAQTAQNERLQSELDSTRELLSKANIAMTEANQELNRLYDENRRLQNEIEHLYSQRTQEQHRTDRMLQTIRDELDDVLMREISTQK